MNHTLVCDTRQVLGMKIDDEFVVVALSSGKFFHFTADSEAFFQSFQTPQSPESFATALGLGDSDRKYLEDFCQLLVRENVLSPCGEPDESPSVPKRFVRPKLIREGDKLLSECEFSYP